MTAKPKFFTTPEKFRAWLEKNHATATELEVGFHKKSSGKKSITYGEALDEALCFGWIDGVKRSLNETSYQQRFTPRRARSIWSLVNVKHVERLKKAGKMHAAGLAAYEQRDPKRTGIYAFENAPRELSEEYEREFRKTKGAWEYFQTYPPYLKKSVSFWVMSAKKEETRATRLQRLIESCAKGERIGMLPKKDDTNPNS
jgi:uncharacterized protein YdeI (YjbR/CyaY-like superfamily)